MLNKIAHSIEMSFDIPTSEVEEASAALEEFKKVLTVLDLAQKHLNIMYDPFKEAQSIKPEDVFKFRGAIHRYKEEIEKNFNKVKTASFLAIMKLNYFTSDTHIMELINTFRDGITGVGDQVNILLDGLDDYKAIDFRDKVITGVDAIKKSALEIDKIVKERIIDYIESNILIKNWMSDTSDELKVKIKPHVPYITQLFEEKQKNLNVTKD